MRTTIVNSDALFLFLKENTKLSWYWIGFLLAIKNKNNVFNVKNKDKLQELSSIIGKKINNHFAFLNKNVIDLLSSIYKNQTHLISNEKIISMLIGIIDGKCSITFYEKKNSLSIFLELTTEYESLVVKILNKVFKLCDETYIHNAIFKKEKIRIYITNPIVINLLYKKSYEYHLPITEKWKKIENYSSVKYEIQRKRETLLPALLEQGYSLKDLSQTLGMSKSNVCRLKRRLKK
jgi:hypothetical protein